MKTVKLIGRGAFTKAYLMENGRVLLKSCDPIKECMAHGWFPESELFPQIEQIDADTYEMEYFPKVRSLKTALCNKDYQLYQELRKLFSSYVPPRRQYQGYSELYELFGRLPVYFSGVTEVLREALDGCGNYGTDIGFEISPRNVAVRNGKLILLDCFFIISKLKEVRKS